MVLRQEESATLLAATIRGYLMRVKMDKVNQSSTYALPSADIATAILGDNTELTEEEQEEDSSFSSTTVSLSTSNHGDRQGEIPSDNSSISTTPGSHRYKTPDIGNHCALIVMRHMPNKMSPSDLPSDKETEERPKSIKCEHPGIELTLTDSLSESAYSDGELSVGSDELCSHDSPSKPGVPNCDILMRFEPNKRDTIDVDKMDCSSLFGSTCDGSEEAGVPLLIQTKIKHGTKSEACAYFGDKREMSLVAVKEAGMGEVEARKFGPPKEIGVQVNQFGSSEVALLERISLLEATVKALRQDKKYTQRVELNNNKQRQHICMLIQEMAVQNLNHFTSSNQLKRQLSMLKTKHKMLLSEKLATDSSSSVIEWENADLRAENADLKAQLESDLSIFTATFQKQASETVVTISLIVLFLVLGLGME